MLRSAWATSALLLSASSLADAETTGLANVPFDKIGLVTALIAAIIVIWKLNGKLANDKDGVQKDLIQFHKDRADQNMQSGANYEKVVNANTTAINSMTVGLEKQGKLLTEILHELEKKAG